MCLIPQDGIMNMSNTLEYIRNGSIKDESLSLNYAKKAKAEWGNI